MSDIQLTLPYEVIISVVGRKYLRDNFTVGSKVSYKIPFNKILIRGSNRRKVFNGIRELSDSIKEHGQQEPFELDVLPDGRYFLKEGERRFRAYKLLIEDGDFKETDLVEFFPTHSKITERDRIIQQFAVNNMKDNFKPLENAAIAFDLKYNCGKEISNEEVAKLMGGISRQTIDNYIKIWEQPDDVKQSLSTMTYTSMLEFLREQKNIQKQADKEEEKAGQSSMYEQPCYKDPLAKEMKDLNELEQKAKNEGQEELVNDLEEIKAGKEHQRLIEQANEIVVSEESLKEQYGKRFAADVKKEKPVNFVDPDTAEVVSIIETTHLFRQGHLIDVQVAKEVIEAGIEIVWVFKNEYNPISKSVITEPVAGEEKSRYDFSREEIDKITKAIQCGDKIEAIVSKLDVPEQTKNDLSYQVHWLQENLSFVRNWVHKNKPQNKRGH